MRAGQSPERKRAKRAWQTMKRRCLEPGFRSFARYGGSGIRICPQWMDFHQFLSDLGVPPSPEHWLGRLDTSKHYTPDNCHWTTHREQMARRQFCRKVCLNGSQVTAAEAARILGPDRNTVLRRWESGLSLMSKVGNRLDRRTVWIAWQGDSLPLGIWAKRLGLPYPTLRNRIKRGMALERAMTSTRYGRNEFSAKP